MKAVDEHSQPDRDKPFLMPVEDVFSISAVVTGRVEAGVIKVGED